jgi:ketosteroid isomerase-like protein
MSGVGSPERGPREGGGGAGAEVKREHSNVEGVRRVFAAFNGGDARALFDVIAKEAVWRVGGAATSVAGTYLGRDDIFELFRLTRRLTDGTYRSDLRWTLADEENAVAVYRETGRRDGRELDIDQALLITIRDGRWTEIVAVPTEPAVFEAFWG